VFNIDLPDMITKVRIYFKGPKQKIALLLFGVVVVAAITTFSLNFISPNDIPPSPKNIPLGGVDIAQYCQSLDYSTNDEESNEDFCSSNIDLDKACGWQYARDDLHIRFSGNDDPESGICYDPQENQIGGISDMRGYCQDVFQKRSPDVKAAVVNGDWTCRTKIDMGLVCTWQYQKKDLVARNDEGTWQCYE
jgi:hypothetical protein